MASSQYSISQLATHEICSSTSNSTYITFLTITSISEEQLFSSLLLSTSILLSYDHPPFCLILEGRNYLKILERVEMDEKHVNQGSNWKGGQWGFGHLRIGIFEKLVTLEISKNSLYKAIFSSFFVHFMHNYAFSCYKIFNFYKKWANFLLNDPKCFKIFGPSGTKNESL